MTSIAKTHSGRSSPLIQRKHVGFKMHVIIQVDVRSSLKITGHGIASLITMSLVKLMKAGTIVIAHGQGQMTNTDKINRLEQDRLGQ